MASTNNITINDTNNPNPKITVRTYALPPTPLIPNSPHVLIHYPGLLTPLISDPSFNPTTIYDLFSSNGWQPQWLARYGPSQRAHYHSTAHECMAVISGGQARILFGVADADEPRAGVLLDAAPGDVFILPAGVAHKTHDPRPLTDGMVFHEPPDRDDAVGSRAFFGGIELRGEFVMMGAYPGGADWDFLTGGELEGRFGEVWRVRVPERDPVLGVSSQGVRGLWGGRGEVVEG